MANPGPKLPGNPRHATVKYRDPADRIIEIDRGIVRTRILAALVERQPLFKWELRERLHIAEQVIYRELQTLRATGKIKAVGRRLTDRKWALVNWQPALVKVSAPLPNENTAIRTKKPEPATDSWWTRPNLTREQFQERARRGADG
jgi:hypothetical protein